MEYDSSKTITLPYFIQKREEEFPGASGKFTNVLLSIALGTKIVSRGVNRAGLASMLGLAGGTNVQGEQVQKLDVFADEVFEKVLGRCGEFFSLVSEEQDQVVHAIEGDATSSYVIAFDPLDGSSNIDVNVSIGTIFGIYRRKSKGARRDPEDNSDFQQAGSAQIAAGYTIYGSSTMFVFSSGNGVNGFTLDPTIGEFILTHPDMKIPDFGKLYSCNESNFTKWSPGVQEYLRQIKGAGDSGQGQYSQRYVGSLVADFHRTLLKGGIFMYPGDKKNPNGKLRHLYECAPMAYLVEQAGGKASDGKNPILSLVPESIHQRTPLFIGSTKNVEHLEKCIAEKG